MHTQMYMLEGASRWNMNRAKDAVSEVGASNLRTFDVCLMSHLNNMSQRVLGCSLMLEITPPGKPTGKISLRAMLSLEYFSILCVCGWVWVCVCAFVWVFVLSPLTMP